MPIYEYKYISGEKAGDIIEINQKINDDPLTICPETQEEIERIISPSSFQLKGTGWYKTDYKYER